MFRADRLTTLYLFQPLRRCVAAYRSSRIPILMYHSVSEPNANGAHPYFETATSQRVFAEHMKYLHETGYRTLRLNEAVKYVESGEQHSEPSLVLTFDDGFQDFYTQAFPILDKYGFNATVFLPTGYIADERRQFKNRDRLTWTEVRELHRAGVTFGSHTVTHRQLKFLKASEVEQEVRCSKEVIEDQLGTPVTSFSYPYAFPEQDTAFTSRLRELLQLCRYQDGVSTIVGTARPGDDRFFLRRLPVNEHDDLLFFKAKLEGGYDWLHGLQYLSKFFAPKKGL